jgi:hypothetical protein
MIHLKPHTNTQQLYFMTIEKRTEAVVFKLRSAQPWRITGHFQTFCSHIYFIMKLLNITAFLCSFPALCIIGAGFIFSVNPPKIKLFFIKRVNILLVNQALRFKKFYCIFVAETYTFNLQKFREISYLVTRFSQTTVLRSFFKSDIPLCFRLIS